MSTVKSGMPASLILFYQGQIDEVKRLGGTPIALDAGRKDEQQIA